MCNDKYDDFPLSELPQRLIFTIVSETAEIRKGSSRDVNEYVGGCDE